MTDREYVQAISEIWHDIKAALRAGMREWRYCRRLRGRNPDEVEL
jgi:hypothetical protein